MKMCVYVCRDRKGWEWSTQERQQFDPPSKHTTSFTNAIQLTQPTNSTHRRSWWRWRA